MDQRPIGAVIRSLLGDQDGSSTDDENAGPTTSRTGPRRRVQSTGDVGASESNTFPSESNTFPSGSNTGPSGSNTSPSHLRRRTSMVPSGSDTFPSQSEQRASDSLRAQAARRRTLLHTMSTDSGCQQSSQQCPLDQPIQRALSSDSVPSSRSQQPYYLTPRVIANKKRQPDCPGNVETVDPSRSVDHIRDANDARDANDTEELYLSIRRINSAPARSVCPSRFSSRTSMPHISPSHVVVMGAVDNYPYSSVTERLAVQRLRQMLDMEEIQQDNRVRGGRNHVCTVVGVIVFFIVLFYGLQKQFSK